MNASPRRRALLWASAPLTALVFVAVASAQFRPTRPPGPGFNPNPGLNPPQQPVIPPGGGYGPPPAANPPSPPVVNPPWQPPYNPPQQPVSVPPPSAPSSGGTGSSAYTYGGYAGLGTLVGLMCLGIRIMLWRVRDN